jgi:hypothetical protein
MAIPGALSAPSRELFSPVLKQPLDKTSRWDYVRISLGRATTEAGGAAAGRW